MRMVDQAILFYLFAAFTGHDGIIAEAARLTDERPELDESVKLEISDRLQEAVSPAGLAHESTSSPAYPLKNVKIIDNSL